MVIDQFSSQVDLCEGHPFSSDKSKDTPTFGSSLHKIPLTLWRIVKRLNAQKKICLKWWFRRRVGPKGEGYGTLLSDEEKRFLILSPNITRVHSFLKACLAILHCGEEFIT